MIDIMKRPNIPSALSFDFRGINDASDEFKPRLFTLTSSRVNDPRCQSLGKAFAAVPALLEALEHLHRLASVQINQSATHAGLENCDALAKARSALVAAGYQF